MNTDNKTVTLSQKNVEELVFFNTDLQKKLPHFFDLFQTWQLGKLIPVLRPTAQKAALDFLERVDEENLAIISEYLGHPVIVEKLDYCIVKNYALNISEAEGVLNGDIDKYDRFFAYRKDGQIYISFWR